MYSRPVARPSDTSGLLASSTSKKLTEGLEFHLKNNESGSYFVENTTYSLQIPVNQDHMENNRFFF
jgi:hypothetical protein